MAAGLPSPIPEEDGRLDQVSMPWSPTRDASSRDLPRLLSQGSLRLRSTLQSQKSLSSLEGASLLRTSSMKVNVALGGDKEPSEALARRSAIRARLEDLDANSDGVIEKEELVDFIEKTIATEKRLQTLTYIAAFAVIALVVFAGATFGLTYVVIDMTKEAQPARGAWVDRSSFNTLRTAHGGFMEVNYTRSPIPQRAHIPGAQAAAADAAAGVDPKADASIVADPTRRLLSVGGVRADAWLDDGMAFDSRETMRELLAKAKPPLGTVARENAETACRWLTEGNINIPLKILDDFGPHFPAGGATVAEAKGCRDLQNMPGSKAEISGTIVFHKTTYVIRCIRGAERCTIRYAPHSGPAKKRQPPAKKGRRLEADISDGVMSECPPVEVAGALQPVPKLSDGTCPNCFPAAALATLPDGSSRPLSHLGIGDRVQVVEEDGSLGWSEVYLFPHFQKSGVHSFLRVSTAANATITLSADHFFLVAPHKAAAFTQRSAVPAASVTPGMLLWRRTSGGSLAVEVVTSVQRISADGLVNPFTLRGNIVVDGVAASVYNTALGGEARMHAFMVLGRGLWRRAPWLLRAMHHARLAQPLSLAIGRLVPAVRRPLLDTSPPVALRGPTGAPPSLAHAPERTGLDSTGAATGGPVLRWATAQLSRVIA